MFGNIDPKEYWTSESGEVELAARIEATPGSRPLPWWTINRDRLKDPFKILGNVSPMNPGKPTQRRESEAAYLARHGELTTREVEMFEAGELPTEWCTWPAYADPTRSTMGAAHG